MSLSLSISIAKILCLHCVRDLTRNEINFPIRRKINNVKWRTEEEPSAFTILFIDSSFFYYSMCRFSISFMSTNTRTTLSIIMKLNTIFFLVHEKRENEI